MTHTAEHPQPKLMKGTGGAPKYFPFARKGNVLLGIAPQAIAKGSAFGVDGTTYFASRLRSAPENGLFAEEDAAKTVVKFQANPENLWDAWPGVTWEKRDNSRASTIVGVFLRGQFDGSTEQKELLLSALHDGALTEKMTDYLIGIAGDALIVTPRELKAWLDEFYGPVIAGIVKAVEKSKAAAAAFEETVGIFGCQTAVLKKIYAETGTTDEGKVIQSGEHDEDPSEEPLDEADEGPADDLDLD